MAEEVALWHTAYEDSVAELSRSGFLQYAMKKVSRFRISYYLTRKGELVFPRKLLGARPSRRVAFSGVVCPFCRLMLTALAEALPQIEAAGASLLALTPETGGLPLTMRRDNGLL